jgi:hypothetical protein
MSLGIAYHICPLGRAEGITSVVRKVYESYQEHGVTDCECLPVEVIPPKQALPPVCADPVQGVMSYRTIGLAGTVARPSGHSLRTKPLAPAKDRSRAASLHGRVARLTSRRETHNQKI